jgi:hypothetical protein
LRGPRYRVDIPDKLMLVIFTSRAYYDITMFGDIAEQLIKMMGHSGTTPGAIGADDIPAALERLRGGVKIEDAKPRTERIPDDEDNEEEEPVSLSNRAFPLMEMLDAAAREHCSVMWYAK